MHPVLLIPFPVFLAVITWTNIKNTDPNSDATVADHLWMAAAMAGGAIAMYIVIRLGWLVVDAVTDMMDMIGIEK